MNIKLNRKAGLQEFLECWQFLSFSGLPYPSLAGDNSHDIALDFEILLASRAGRVATLLRATLPAHHPIGG